MFRFSYSSFVFSLLTMEGISYSNEHLICYNVSSKEAYLCYWWKYIFHYISRKSNPVNQSLDDFFRKLLVMNVLKMKIMRNIILLKCFAQVILEKRNRNAYKLRFCQGFSPVDDEWSFYLWYSGIYQNKLKFSSNIMWPDAKVFSIVVITLLSRIEFTFLFIKSVSLLRYR